VWLGDTVAYEVLAGGQPVRVIRPTAEAAFAPGAAVVLLGGADALAFLSETEMMGEAA
jgi:hypothetical protein